jgi:hypothetical protein
MSLEKERISGKWIPDSANIFVSGNRELEAPLHGEATYTGTAAPAVAAVRPAQLYEFVSR